MSENMNMISRFQPTMVRSAVSPGTVQNAEYSVRCMTHPFQVSLKKSTPKTARAEKTASQLPVCRACRISRP